MLGVATGTGSNVGLFYMCELIESLFVDVTAMPIMWRVAEHRCAKNGPVSCNGLLR